MKITVTWLLLKCASMALCCYDGMELLGFLFSVYVTHSYRSPPPWMDFTRSGILIPVANMVTFGKFFSDQLRIVSSVGCLIPIDKTITISTAGTTYHAADSNCHDYESGKGGKGKLR